MKSNIKNSLMFVFIITGLLISSTNAIANVTVDVIPEEPKALQTIEITTQITDENINAVYLKIQECNGDSGLCYAQDNITMTGTIDNIYTSSITLTHDDATYLQYTIVVQTDQGWTEYHKDTKVNYEIPSSNDNGDTNDGDNTPGFEFAALALSIMFISLILYRRK